MGKLKALIQFECVTTLKFLIIFYCIEYSILAVTFFLTYLGRGSVTHPYFACLELCSVIFIFIFGLFGFREDFKMLMQNGFTRKYIFLATVVMFVQTAALLAVVDTIAAEVLTGLSPGYISGFEAVYGPGQAWWIQLLSRFALYMVMVCFGYVGAVLGTRIGKKRMMIVGITLWCLLFVVVPVIFNVILSDTMRYNVATFIYSCAGFTDHGDIRFGCPMLSMLVFISIGFGGAFAMIRRAPLR